MDTYTISALAIGGFALVIGLSRLIFRAVHIAKNGPSEAHHAGPGGFTVETARKIAFRSEKRTRL